MSSLELQRARAQNLTLEFKIISASDVSHTHIDDKDSMDVYAVVSINGDHPEKKQAAKAPIDYDGGSNPTWNHTVKFSVNEKAAHEGLLTVKVKLLSFWLEGENDLYMGEVNVSVQELLASNPIPPYTKGNSHKMKSMSCPIEGTEGSTKARLFFSYRFKPISADDLYPSAPVSLFYKPASPVDDQYPSAPDYSLLVDQPVYPNPDQPRSGLPVMYSPENKSTMTELTLEIVIKFAKGIKDVNTFSAMDVYASVLILKGKMIVHEMKTPTAFSAYTNPVWDHQVMAFTIDAELAQEGCLTLVVKLISAWSLSGDKDIGRVKVPMEELLRTNPPSLLTNSDANVMKLVTHNVTEPYGSYGGKGQLCFSYRFLGAQGTLPSMPTTTFNPPVPHLPVSIQSNESFGMVRGTPGYYHLAAPPRAQAGPSNGQLTICMKHPHQSHEYQQYSQSQQQQPLPQPQMQSERLVLDPQGRSMVALGVGATVMGRPIGGVLMSDMK